MSVHPVPSWDRIRKQRIQVDVDDSDVINRDILRKPTFMEKIFGKKEKPRPKHSWGDHPESRQ